MNNRHHHFGDEQTAPRIMPFWLAIIVVPLSVIAALIIEAVLIACYVASATWTTCIVGNEKAAVRRRFK